MLQSLPSVPTTTSLLYPEGFLSPLEIDAAVERALAEDLGRAGDVTSIATIPAGTPGPCRRGRAQGRRDLRIAAGRGRVPTAGARYRDQGECPRRRQRRGEDRADDHRGRRARGALGRTRGAQSVGSSLRHRHRDRRLRAAHEGHARPASAAPARPRRACARSRNTRCAAAAASIIAWASTTPC